MIFLEFHRNLYRFFFEIEWDLMGFNSMVIVHGNVDDFEWDLYNEIEYHFMVFSLFLE